MSDINVQTFQGKVNISNNLKVGSGHLFVDTLNNQVGLNTNTPLANLHVNGNTYVHNDFRVGSGIVMDQKVATFGTPKTFVVEVVGGVFQIDGVSRPALTFHENQTYIFDQSDGSNNGHPIAFSEAVNGGTPYPTGVTSVGTPGQAGAKTTFKVPVGAPSNLFYYCTQHPTSMGSTSGAPSVVSTEAEVIVSGRLLATSIHGDGSALFNIPSSAINGTLSQWNDVNTNEIYYDLGNVGIGNQNPNSTLDVTGSGAFSTTLSVGGDLTVGTDKLFVDVSTGQVGVGTTTPATGKALDVVGDLQATYLYGDGSNINNITSSQWVTTGNDIYYDTGSVRVGSNQAPTETLDVTGTGAFSDDLTVGASKLVVDVSESRVGINKAAPGYTLDVLGDINFTGDIRKGGVVQTFGGGGGGGGGVWTEITGTTQIHYSTGNVGVANTNPQHTLSVGSNLYVDDAGSNVLVVDGNVAANQITLGQFEIVPSYGLDDVVNESNTTTKTVHLSNVTTGVITTSNALIGGELTVTGNMVASSNITVTGNVVVDDDLYLTSNVKLLVNSNTVVEYTGPHGRDGAAVLKKYPEIIFEDGKFDSNDSTNTYVQAGYTVSTDSVYNDRQVYRAFSTEGGKLTTTTHVWSSEDVGGNGYNQTTGDPISGITFQDENGTSYTGHYIKLELPKKIKLNSISFKSQKGDYNSTNNDKRPTSGTFLGSTDGTNWTLLKTFDEGDLVWSGGSVSTNEYLYSTTLNNIVNDSYFSYILFIIETVVDNNSYGPTEVRDLKYYGYEEDPPAGDTSVDTTFTSIMNTPQTTGANVYTDAKLSSDFTNQVTGPTPVGTAAVHDNTNKYWEMNGQLTSNITVEANTFLEGDQPHAVSVWFNSSNLEANVSNTCVFSISDQEKLDSVNLDLQSNTWHNLTYAYQGEGGSRVTYLDGRKVAEDQAEDTFGDYPPFAMTGYSQGGYVVSQSSVAPSTGREVWKAFDNDNTTHFEGNWNVVHYDANTGDVDGDQATTTNVDGSGTYQGEWIQIEFPHKIVTSYYELRNRVNFGYRMPENAKLLGSNDGISWTTVYNHSDTGGVYTAAGETRSFGVGSNRAYKYFRLVTNKLFTNTSSSASDTPNIATWKLYGHRENDLVRLPDPTNVLKYPHIAMTGPAQRGYVASGSADNYNSAEFYTYSAFNNIQGNEGWHGGADNSTTVYHFSADPGGSIYDTSKGGSLGGNSGEWLKLELPHKIVVDYIILKRRTTNTTQVPKDFKILGSNNDVDWDILQTVTGASTDLIQNHTIGAITGYKYLAILVTRVHATVAIDVVISELEFFGTGVDSVPIQIGGGNIDKVANFRVYDKFVGEDQALEIWDAQKDEFGRAKSSMTLQKGRLGIGTTEPEGRLAVADEPDPDTYGLQEYPPKPLAGYETRIEEHGIYKVSVSGLHVESLRYAGWKAFNDNADGGGEAWITPDPSYNNGAQTFNKRLSSNTLLGEYIVLEFPYKVKIRSAKLHERGGNTNNAPSAGVFYGSNDGVSWTELKSFSGLTYDDGAGVYSDVEINATDYFKKIALVVTNIGSTASTWMGLGELRYFGYREQVTKQSVLHDGQLTLTKSLNVPRIGPALDADDTPRRDRLVVEYNTSTNPTFEGAVRDTSGRGNDGFMKGLAIYDATKKALVFDGATGATSSVIEVGEITNYNTNWVHSVSVWLNMHSPANYETVYSFGDPAAAARNNIAIHIANTQFLAESTGGSSTNYWNITGGAWKVGIWEHFVFVRDGSLAGVEGFKIYQNGVELASTGGTNASTAIIIPRTSTFRIGQRITSVNDQPYDGDLSQFKLYDTALTAEEVKTLYDMGRLGNVIPKPLHVDTTLQVNGLFQGNSPLQFFVINGVHGASTSNQNVSLPPGLLGSKIVSITGMTFNTNGDGIPFTRHSEAAWEVDVYYSSHGSSPDNQLVLSGRTSAVDDLPWRIFVVTT